MHVWLIRERAYGHDETPAVLGVYATEQIANRVAEKHPNSDLDVQRWRVMDHVCVCSKEEASCKT